jgi:alkyl hydroperoxide reductase subunit AhpF
MNEIQRRFDNETWAQLPQFFDNLPEPVRLTVWGEEEGSPEEREAVILGRALAGRFSHIHFNLRPRRINYSYYPVIGVMAEAEPEPVDYGLRLIGLPAGYQMTSLVAAIQAVSFRGMSLAARTRIRLHKLSRPVTIEMVTAAADEGGGLVAHLIFNMAVISPHIRSYLIMGDAFPDAVIRYSVSYIPHLIINGRVHVSGVIDEDELLKHIGRAVIGDR